MADQRDHSALEISRHEGRFASRQERRGRIHLRLRVLEASPPEPKHAGTYLGPSGYRTYASPHRFNVNPGVVYRIKSRAQEGLGAELIGNRLAHRLDVGPASEPILVRAAALPADGRLNTLLGLQLGVVELESVLNDDELRAFGVRLQADQVDWESWARVVALQTWVFAGDHQAVVRMTDGKVFSVDHGKCFAELVRGEPTGAIAPALFGITGGMFEVRHVEDAIEAVESISEAELVGFVANVPNDPDRWRMSPARQLRIAEWLLDRQFGVRKVLAPWMSRLT